jgi:proliferating cell nuclear antigen
MNPDPNPAPLKSRKKSSSSKPATPTPSVVPDASQEAAAAETKTDLDSDTGEYLVRFQTSQALQLKVLLDVLKDLITEVNIKFDTDHMKLVSLDPGRVGMCHLVINKLEYYYCREPLYVGIYIQYLYKLMRSVTTSHHLEWRVRTENPSILEIVVSNPERRIFTTHKIKTLSLDIEEVTIPQVNFEYVISMPTSDLQKYVKELSHVSNIITVSSSGKDIELTASGDLGETTINVAPTPSGLNWVNKYLSSEEERFQGRYFLRYLDKMLKSQVDNTIELYIKKDYPLVLKYNLTIGSLRFVVSPIVSEP